MPVQINDEYDIGKAFAAIEDELMASMIRNMNRHKVEEVAEDKQWSMWQAEQLKALERYKRTNRKKYGQQFQNINNQITALIRMARDEGEMDQEIAILRAIQRGFSARRLPRGANAEFFKLNERKLEALIKATTDDMQKAETAVLRMANDRYRKVIFNAQVYATTGAGTYEKAVDMATRDFIAAGMNCVEYKNGARHTLSDYADMAIRTAAKRAYLQGEGTKRAEWGIATVIMNKRGNPCPKCLPFCGKVLIDDVWSGGSRADGKYPLMSYAIEQGLYHPRCKDHHTTYFPGISTADDTWTDEELENIGVQAKKEAKQQYAKRQMERFGRLARYSLDEQNREIYATKHDSWENMVDVEDSQEYRPIDRSNNQTEFTRGNKNVSVRQIVNSMYSGNVYISDSVKLKPKQMHNIEKSLNDALEIVGGGGNLPKVMIISSEEMQTGAICSYNAVENVLYVDSIIGDVQKLLELQKDMACPDNPLSTYVHELIHWKDAEEYRKGGKIHSQKEYLLYLRKKSKKILDKMMKKGYNTNNISKYATDKRHEGAYDETWTEYRVLKLLGRKGE